MERSPDLEAMIRAAELAAGVLMRAFGDRGSLRVSEKGPADYVTTADLAAERAIRDVLGSERPDYAMLAEESADVPVKAARSRFVVDPLDGSTNFLHGIPHYAISIALETDGEVVAGVVLDPAKGELFWAERGRGCFLGDRAIVVSSCTELAHAVVTTGIPHRNRGDHADYLRSFPRVMGAVAGVRRFGAAALDLAYVAAGRCDAFYETGLSRWDVAAGTLLVREAGGVVTEIDGGARVLDTGSVLATNSALHGAMSTLLHEGR